MKVIRPFGGIQGQVPSLGSVRDRVMGVIHLFKRGDRKPYGEGSDGHNLPVS